MGWVVHRILRGGLIYVLLGGSSYMMGAVFLLWLLWDHPNPCPYTLPPPLLYSKPNKLISSLGWTGVVYHWYLGGEGKCLHKPQENNFSSTGFCFCVPSTQVCVGACILGSQAQFLQQRPVHTTSIKIRKRGQMQVLGHGILKEHRSREGRPFPRCPLAKQIDHPIRQPLTLGRNKENYFLPHCCL